jgi:hypothetical protein
MTTSRELQKFGDYRVQELAGAGPAEMLSHTALHLRMARTDAQDMLRLDIPALLAHRKTTAGLQVDGYLHRAVPLELLAGRVVPAISGLRRLGEQDKADALERDWNDWIAGFNAIAADCPPAMPEDTEASRALTTALARRLQELLEDVVWTLEHAFAAEIASRR